MFIRFTTKAFLACTLAITLCSCASGYYHKARSAHQAYKSGDFKRAANLIRDVKPTGRDKLLHLLDMGMILHGAGEYSESNEVLTKAEDLAEGLRSKSVSREVSATLWSEEATEFSGERFERMLIPTIKLLNYILLDEWKEALVEVRHMQTLAEREFGKAKDFDNAFSTYLSAMIWETSGLINDAYIDYNKLGIQNKHVPYFAHDLKFTSGKLGFKPKLPKKEMLAWSASENYRKELGEFVVIAEVGQAPKFISESVSTGFFTVAVPTLIHEAPPVEYVDISIDGKGIARTYTFYDITGDMVGALKDRQKRSLIRKMIKLSAQGALYGVADEMMKDDKTENQLIGLAMAFLSLSMSAAEKADERSWRTLPSNLQIGRVFLKPGIHKITLTPIGGGKATTEEVTIEKATPKYVLLKFPDTLISSAKSLTARDVALSKAAIEEQKLIERAKQNPDDGDLKIQLAIARIKNGNYDIETLATKGINQGGDKEKGYLALIIAHAVNARFETAADYSKTAADAVNVKKAEESFREYEKTFSALNKSEGKIEFHPKKAEDLELALNLFIEGLIAERDEEYPRATKKFALSYENGLKGEQIESKILDNYGKSDKNFKKSKEGMQIVENLADSLLEGAEM